METKSITKILKYEAQVERLEKEKAIKWPKTISLSTVVSATKLWNLIILLVMLSLVVEIIEIRVIVCCSKE